MRGRSTFKAGVQGFSDKNYGVYGESKDFAAVAGSSLNSTGVTGSSVNEIGIIGYSENGVGGVLGYGGLYQNKTQYGVKGEAFGSSTGVLAKGNDANSTALVVDGKMKISGIGQSPAAGKILTSDASGNATWQNPQTIAFRASSLKNDANQSIPVNTAKKVLFNQQARYNIGNAYDADNSIFFPSVAGVYHLNVQVDWTDASPYTILYIKLLRNGTISNIAYSRSGRYTKITSHTPSITTEIALQANDAVWIEIYQENDGGNSMMLSALGYTAWFTGHLVTRM